VGAVLIIDEASVSLVREEVRRAGAEVGLAAVAIERGASAASELAHNQLAHAKGGQVVVRAIAREGVPGIEIVATDRGPGIADPTTALRGDGRVTGSLGIGLSAAVRLVDELDADVRWGEGTTIAARLFARSVVKSEIAILGRPIAGEHVCGDHAGFVRNERGWIVAVADGLGHGEHAAHASERAIAAFRAHHGAPLVDLVTAIERDVTGTRGVAMSIARDDGAGQLEHAAVGNVTTVIHARDGKVRPLGGVAGVLGGRRPGRVPIDRAPIDPYQVLVMYTDGLKTRIDFAAAPDVLRAHPLAIAHFLLVHFGRPNDDALVLVAR
jgi:anti-sigma regulatory factor (Ser/Thr protein kinase)